MVVSLFLMDFRWEQTDLQAQKCHIAFRSPGVQQSINSKSWNWEIIFFQLSVLPFESQVDLAKKLFFARFPSNWQS